MHPPSSALGWLTAQPFAHRGLHDECSAPENSLAAIDRAIAADHGVELDVRLTSDGHAVVFHDDTLDRLTSLKGDVSRYPLSRLQSLPLLQSKHCIPDLSSVMMHIASRVPILLEAKCPGLDYRPLCYTIRRSLEGYRGPVAIMSFNPEIVRWFARNAPNIARGLVLSNQPIAGSWWQRPSVRRRLMVWRANPQFLAFDIRTLPGKLALTYREKGLPILAWTVRSPEDQERARLYADNIIYDPSPEITPKTKNHTTLENFSPNL